MSKMKIKVHEHKVQENTAFNLGNWAKHKPYDRFVCPYCGKDDSLENIDHDGDGLEDWWCDHCKKDFVVEYEMTPVKIYYDSTEGK